jgi:hypothetical protein
MPPSKRYPKNTTLEEMLKPQGPNPYRVRPDTGPGAGPNPYRDGLHELSPDRGEISRPSPQNRGTLDKATRTSSKPATAPKPATPKPRSNAGSRTRSTGSAK